MAGTTLNGGGRRGRGIITEINVTPLVDIMLVLLIIFMVTTTTLVYDALDIKLPEAATGESKAPSLLSLVVDDNGKVFLNGKPASERRIRNFIRSERRRNKQLEAIIAADERVAHGRVVRVIDLVRSEGVIKFAITVIKKVKKE
jgi:biopolymer transport protein ExbD